MTLAEVLHRMVYGQKMKVKHIAEAMGHGTEWPLQKALSLTEEGYRFPAVWLVPMMRLLKDYSPLHHIAQRCGFIAIPIKQVRIGRKADLGKLAEVYGQAATVLQHMYEEGEISGDGFDAVYKLLREVSGHYKAAQKYKTRQTELEL